MYTAKDYIRYPHLSIREITQVKHGEPLDEKTCDGLGIALTADHHNAEVTADLITTANELVKLTSDVFKEGSLQHKYISKAVRERTFLMNYQLFDSLLLQINEELEEQRKEQEEQEKREQQETQKETTGQTLANAEWTKVLVKDHGLVLGTDFEFDEAREVGVDLTIKRIVKQNKGVFIFDECEYCCSWEYGEHRCSCGNSRVEFTVSNTHSPTSMTCHPFAY